MLAVTALRLAIAITLLPLASSPAAAYMAYVTNERDNTLSVIDLDQMKTVNTVPVGQRPRGHREVSFGQVSPAGEP